MPFVAPPDYLPSFEGRPVQLGIDEAGRGPVVGPMVYGCCYSPIDHADFVAKSGFADSKQLNEQRRESLWSDISTKRDQLQIGYIVNILSAEAISTQMLRRTPHNLNSISHDAAIAMIRKVVDAGAKIEEVYVDTVGDPVKYEMKLKALFPNIRMIKVCPKADSLFPIVSAASICAKVNRDLSVAYIASIMKENERIQDKVTSVELGSGYPSDERTKDWMKASIDPVFLYPSIVRFSWDTVNQVADAARAIEFDFNDEVDEKQPNLVNMFSAKKTTPVSRMFLNRNIKLVV